MKLIKLKEGLLTGILHVLFARELENRLDSVIDQIDTKKAEEAAKEVRDSLAKLEIVRRNFCRRNPKHTLCKKDVLAR
jgi:hypothetical protein